MTNPLLDKFYELHPEKKEVVQEQKPEIDPITSYPISHNKDFPDKTATFGTFGLDLKEAQKRSYRDTWTDWMEAYKQATSNKPAPIDPVLSSLSSNSNGVTVSQYNNSIAYTKTIKQDYERYKINYEFVEMSEKIKKNKANVVNVTCNTDHYRMQKHYIFEVICDD